MEPSPTGRAVGGDPMADGSDAATKLCQNSIRWKMSRNKSVTAAAMSYKLAEYEP